ncbi:MAG: alpha-galactosidase [Firmicutes bacterium]|nr:alpha-galactosidase [Bacillota bacterium]
MEQAEAFVRERFMQAPGQPPISFIYDGNPSADLLPKWHRDNKEEWLSPSQRRYAVSYSDPVTGLLVGCDAVVYDDYPAVEWVGHFQCRGTEDTPILERIEALDLTLQPTDKKNVFLHWARGSELSCADFAPECAPLPPHWVAKTLGSVGGRSSSGGYPPSNLGGTLPFFNLELSDEGIMIAVGWSGQWRANFEHRPDGWEQTGLSIRAGMELTHLRLHAGERIRTPRILLVFWKGDRLRGHNLLRGFLLRHKLPRAGNGEPVVPPIAANAWGIFDAGNKVTEQNQTSFAELYVKKRIGLEYFWIDAGWFEGGWPYGTGNWHPKKDAFPQGLKAVSDAVHRMGLKFLVWFEPERVCPGTQIHREHPEWLLRRSNSMTEVWPEDAPEFFLLNLGDPDACQWLTEHISQIIDREGIDAYRQDFNMDPLPFWREADAEDRQGISEIRYVEGLYRFWDQLLARHPGLIIDNCASGGRRIDLETISRSIALTVSDYYKEPIGTQRHTYGLSLYVPGFASGCVSTDPYNFRGSLSGGAVLGWDVRDKDFPDAVARGLVAEALHLRPLFHGNFYPLTPYHAEPDQWLAYQFDRPDLGNGMVLAFRWPKSPISRMLFSLQGLKPAASYEVSDANGKRISSSRDLIQGLEVIIPDPASSALITYHEVS